MPRRVSASRPATFRPRRTESIQRRVGKRIAQRLNDPTACFVLAVNQGRVIGLNGAALASPTGQNMITGVCVDPAHQGRGLGAALLARSLEWLRDQGLAQATVTTDAAAAAARVYARFDAIRVENTVYRDPPKHS